jgi:hypothetical protein
MMYPEDASFMCLGSLFMEEVYPFIIDASRSFGKKPEMES